MDIKRDYPDFATIEEHIRRAHLERSLVLSQMLVDLGMGTWKGLTRLFTALGKQAARTRAAASRARLALRTTEIEPYLGR